MKLAIIGGSGIRDSPIFKDVPWGTFETGYTTAHAQGTVEYQLSEEGLIFIPRHGKSRFLAPSKTQYAANIIAAKQLGAEAILAISATGTYKEHIGVESLVIPQDYVDESGRDDNLFGDGFVVHTGSHPAFSSPLRAVLINEGRSFQKYEFTGFNTQATYVVIPGDRFGTRAEGKKRAAYADIVGMTICPEAAMAKQLGIHYAPIGLPVDKDFDANHEGATLEIMKRLSQEHRVPAYVRAVAIEIQKLPCTPVEGLRGNIIPITLDHVTNKHLRSVAEELVKKYA